MDEHNNDPYEQQLFAVFQSCLIKGDTELQEDAWLTLCHKLHLIDQSDELRSCIQKHKPEKRTISFQEFRTALLTLLGKTQGLIAHPEKDITIESQKHINPCNNDAKKCESLPQAGSKPHIDVLNIKTGVTLDENRLKCLWERINTCLKESVDSTTMYLISNCLGIPALPKQIMQCIFEKLDQNCDGLITLDEFLVIFQSKRSLHEQLMLECNDESLKALTKSDSKKRGFDILPSRKTSNSFTRSSTFLDVWNVAGITNTTSLLSDGGVESSDICLAELTTTLCDELKSLNDSLDHSAIRSHITLLRDVLTLYQEELNSLNVLIENINGEKEKLRIDMVEANERANALAQELDEQHVRQEEIKQNLCKQIEQRHAEIIQNLSDQLNSEREMNTATLKSKDDQIQVLQKENHEIRNKFVNTLQENQVLECENENLRSQIEKLKQSNNELLTQIKMLAAEHDEAQNIEAKQQQEVIYLIDRIKQLQSDAVLLRDQNDELTVELETLRLRDCHIRDTRQNNVSNVHSTRNVNQVEAEDKDGYVADEESEFEILLKHSGSMSCTSTEEEDAQNCKRIDLKHFKELIIKQLKNLLTSTKCTLENCAFKDEISAIIDRFQSNYNTHALKEVEFGKSIASELEIECEERTSESLRDLVVSNHKTSALAKRASVTNSNSDVSGDMADNFNSKDSKNTSQNKIPSLRDYPPRKEHTVTEQSKSNNEKDSSLNYCIKVSNENNNKSNSSTVRNEFISDITTANIKLQELEAAYAIEKKQLTERCSVLEKSLELLKTEYEECEDYWAAKLEEERQLFEQEQKISDEKFSELIAKMAEYEELISPVGKTDNSGRLSPIEEKFNLEQQYLDLEEEFEKWKVQMEEEISQKDKEVKSLQEKLKSLERPIMTDISVQATEETASPNVTTQMNHVPTSSYNIPPSSESTSILNQCNENIRKLSDEFKLDRIIESSVLTNDFITRVTKEEMCINDFNPHQLRAQYPVKDINSASKFEKPELSRKKAEIGAKSSVLLREEDKRDTECEIIQNALKLQNLKPMNCHCMQGDTQRQVCCVDVNILQNLNMRLQAQERKKNQLQDCFRRQQHHIEQVLHRIMSQHQTEVSELQCLLRNTQERLQRQFQTSAEQAEKLARADVLVKDLYIENACLMANVKRLEQHCHILTGFNAESTSI